MAIDIEVHPSELQETRMEGGIRHRILAKQVVTELQKSFAALSGTSGLPISIPSSDVDLTHRFSQVGVSLLSR